MTSEKVRLDKWLWAARFFKTRSIAATAITGGKVQVNGRRVKRASLLAVGDRVRVRKRSQLYEVIVKDLSQRRGPASVAAELYEETAEGRLERERLASQRKAAPTYSFREKGKPTKKERRQLSHLKRKPE